MKSNNEKNEVKKNEVKMNLKNWFKCRTKAKHKQALYNNIK
jgi:hypothetical protein